MRLRDRGNTQQQKAEGFCPPPQTVDKPMLPKFDTHGESAKGDWLFPLAIDILKNENFLGSSHF